MNNYPYSPNSLNDLTNLRDNYIKSVKMAIKTYININDVDIYNDYTDICEDNFETKAITTSVLHNDFILTEISIGQLKL